MIGTGSDHLERDFLRRKTASNDLVPSCSLTTHFAIPVNEGQTVASSLELVETTLRKTEDPSDALSKLRSQVDLNSLASEIVQDRVVFDSVAAQSYCHDNGFNKIPLSTPSGSALKLVLHHWDGAGASDDNIHNHRWRFASVVLRGALCFELYDERPSGEAYSKATYASPEGHDDYRLSNSGHTHAACLANLELAAGTAYQWHEDLLHRAWGKPGIATATLIVQGQPTRRQTDILLRGKSDGHSSDVRPLQRLEPSALHAALTTLSDSELACRWAARPS